MLKTILTTDVDQLVSTGELNDKWGYIDKNGKEVINLQYDRAYIFTKGRAAVDKDHKRLIIDKQGKIVN